MIDNIEYSNNDESKLVDQQRSSQKQVIIIGAGPAGLTAGYELAKLDLHPTILETGDKVGGLARTENYKGFYFDIGGHRFFTKVEEVNKLWHELLGENLLRRPRLSRIYYKGRFFDYPLKPFNALFGLGVFESFFDRRELHPLAAVSVQGGGIVRAVGYESFRKTAFPDIFSKPIRKKYGEFPAQNLNPNGRRSASRICRSRPPS